MHGCSGSDSPGSSGIVETHGRGENPPFIDRNFQNLECLVWVVELKREPSSSFRFPQLSQAWRARQLDRWSRVKVRVD